MGSEADERGTLEERTPESRTLSERDRGFLDRAIGLGRRGWGRVHPNPLVGCVVVHGDEIVGEGWHQEFGKAHAEVVALSQAGERARGAEAFISLEPCRHEGQTPPCILALEEAGITRVVYGAADPGEASGGGGQALRDRGVEVVGPVLSAEAARWENPVFFHETPDRPWTALKLAISADGMIAGAPGVRTAVSDPEADQEVHLLRAGFDGIVVGSRTALVDDPQLTVRGPVEPRIRPRRILVDARGRIPDSARALAEAPDEAWMVTTGAASADWKARLRSLGVRILEIRANQDRTVHLPSMMGTLKAEGLRSLLCEGGGVFGSALLRARLVDRVYLLVSPDPLGAGAVPAFHELDTAAGPGSGGTRIPRGWVPGEEPRRVGRDLWLALTPEEG